MRSFDLLLESTSHKPNTCFGHVGPKAIGVYAGMNHGELTSLHFQGYSVPQSQTSNAREQKSHHCYRTRQKEDFTRRGASWL